MQNLPKHRLLSLYARAALAVLLSAGGAAGSAAAASTLNVAIGSSQFGTASGYLDMQLSASSGVPLTTVVVDNLAGFNGAAVVESWGVAPVAGGWIFRNDTSNDLFQSVNFGGVLSFNLTFAGEADPATSYVSHFVVSAFDGSYGLVGSYDPVTGALADFAWTPALAAQAAGSVGVAGTGAIVSAVPEPADWMMIAGGLAALALARRRRVRVSSN